MKLLVTGGAGFIGSAVVRLAVARAPCQSGQFPIAAWHCDSAVTQSSRSSASLISSRASTIAERSRASLRQELMSSRIICASKKSSSPGSIMWVWGLLRCSGASAASAEAAFVNFALRLVVGRLDRSKLQLCGSRSSSHLFCPRRLVSYRPLADIESKT